MKVTTQRRSSQVTAEVGLAQPERQSSHTTTDGSTRINLEKIAS